MIKKLKTREIKGSLKTRDVLIARHRATMLNRRFELFFSEEGRVAALTHETVRELARAYFQDCLNRSDELLSMMQLEGVDLVLEANSAASMLLELKAEQQSTKFGPVTEDMADKILRQSGMRPEKVGIDLLRLLKSAVVRARMEDLRIMLAKLTGDIAGTATSDPWFLGMDVSGFPQIGSEAVLADEKPKLVETVEKFHKSRQGRVAAKTGENEKLVLSICVELLGSGALLSAIGVSEVRAIRDAFENMPVHTTKRADLRELSINQLLQLKNLPKLSPKTQWKYFNVFRTFLNWSVAEGYLERMPAPQISVAKPSRLDELDARKPFSLEQLKRLFSSPLYAGHATPAQRSKPGALIIHDGKWWIPIIGLLSGLRLGEIVQLLPSDIKNIGGVLYFDVARNDDEKKQIKNASSVRRVPVHRTLIDLGFAQAVDAARKRGDRIFYDIKPGSDGYFSHNFSKWFGRYLDDIGIKSAKLVFHSFRHNFKDGLSAAGVPRTVEEALMGHADGSVHGTYGSGQPIELLNENLQKLDFGELDLLSLL